MQSRTISLQFSNRFIPAPLRLKGGLLKDAILIDDLFSAICSRKLIQNQHRSSFPRQKMH